MGQVQVPSLPKSLSKLEAWEWLQVFRLLFFLFSLPASPFRFSCLMGWYCSETTDYTTMLCWDLEGDTRSLTTSMPDKMEPGLTTSLRVHSCFWIVLGSPLFLPLTSLPVEETVALFSSSGYETIENGYITRETVNKKEGISAQRIFVQGKFRKPMESCSTCETEPLWIEQPLGNLFSSLPYWNSLNNSKLPQFSVWFLYIFTLDCEY